MIGRFELVREIGRGGFGVVWEARDRELGRSVAFKSVRAGGAAALREERLLREAEAAAQLTHPNIVTLHDVGRCDRGPYLVMELLRGRSLAERLDPGALPLDEALHVATEVARGVAHAHAHGVIHRDLKPENVYLCRDGQVKVVDFGLAHALGQRIAQGGTPAYMAPEQRTGEAEDERTDVFAMGVILHRMITGALPPAEPEGAAPRPPPGLPPDVAALVASMLQPEPARRPRDGAAVLAALTGLRRALEAPAPARGLPRIWAVPGVLLLVLVAAGLGVVLTRNAPRPPAPPAAVAAAPVDPGPTVRPEALAMAESLQGRAVQALGDGLDDALARTLLRNALAFDPGHAPTHFQLVLLGEDPAALTGPTPPAWGARLPPRDQKVLAALRTGGAEGRRLLEALATAAPDDVRLAVLAGDAAAAEGDLWSAVDRYRAALTRQPAYLPALDAALHSWNALGVWGRDIELLRMAERAQAVRPSAASQAYLAVAHALRGEREEALAAARRVQDGGGELSFRVAARLAAVWLDVGQGEQAEALLRRWTGGDADPAVRRQATWALGRALAAQGRAAELRQLAGQVNGLPGLQEALLGLAKYTLGDEAAAVAAWRQRPAGAAPLVDPAWVAWLDPRPQPAACPPGAGVADDALCKAVLQGKAGQGATAAQALDRLRARWDRPMADLLAGELHAAAGEPDRAADALARYLARHDGLACERIRARQTLARVQAALGDAAGARATLDALLADLARADAGLPAVAEAQAAREKLRREARTARPEGRAVRVLRFVCAAGQVAQRRPSTPPRPCRGYAQGERSFRSVRAESFDSAPAWRALRSGRAKSKPRRLRPPSPAGGCRAPRAPCRRR
ncbi:MAG: protein kinase [Anaeromyxobacter sp.]